MFTEIQKSEAAANAVAVREALEAKFGKGVVVTLGHSYGTQIDLNVKYSNANGGMLVSTAFNSAADVNETVAAAAAKIDAAAATFGY